MHKIKLSLWQITLISTGGMLGCGWLFSPFYGYQSAGVGVILSWIITAIITAIIGLSFAEVCSMLPIVGGVSRFIGITHNRTMSFVFLVLGWLSYVVYLPLEAQSVIQYIGFWFKDLVVTNSGGQFELSHLGLLTGALIIGGITWFNTLIITKIAKFNSAISIWKIAIPILVAIIVIAGFGHWNNFTAQANFTKCTGENIFLAVTSSGLAFAFSGFQNGLILANQVKNPRKALPYSLFMPIIVGLVLYMSLSLSFITALDPSKPNAMNAVAPLLGLISLLGLNILFTVLFIDSILAPFGTTNVYVAVTSRILEGLGKDFMPGSILTKLNKHDNPTYCLWINAVIGVIFLFPFPTWKALVSFLSSIVVFAYLAGPVTLLVLRHKYPDLKRGFSLKQYNLIGYLGFICCSLLIYWSGLINLVYLSATLIIVIALYGIINKSQSIFQSFITCSYLIAYSLSLTLISYLRNKNIIPFPIDNYLVCAIGLIGCYAFVKCSLSTKTIHNNLTKINVELAQ